MRFQVLMGAGIALLGLSQDAWACGHCRSTRCCVYTPVHVVECAPVVTCSSSSSKPAAVKCCGTARKQIKASYFDTLNSTWVEADALVSIDDAVVGAQVELSSGGKTIRAWVISVGEGPKGPPATHSSSPTMQGARAAAATPADPDAVASLK